MMSSSGVKRSANSPLSNDEKKHQVQGDSIVDNPDATIIDSSFLRSAALDDPAHTMSAADSTIIRQPCATLVFWS